MVAEALVQRRTGDRRRGSGSRAEATHRRCKRRFRTRCKSPTAGILDGERKPGAYLDAVRKSMRQIRAATVAVMISLCLLTAAEKAAI